ncbi:MAG: YrrC family ATP-dependent DNA helicase [Gammaproteobacteria bacterium]
MTYGNISGTQICDTPERLSGSIDGVYFHSEESGFCVLLVKVKDSRDLVTVIGSRPASRLANSSSALVSETTAGTTA